MALTVDEVRREIERLRDRRRRTTDPDEKAALEEEIARLMAVRDAMVEDEDRDFAADIRAIVANLEKIRTSHDLSAESAIGTAIANLKAGLPPAG